jgi:hypothetical protein
MSICFGKPDMTVMLIILSYNKVIVDEQFRD